jgi:DNA-binding ferritin-like protein
MSDAKVLTTAEVEALPERIPGAWALVRRDDLLATTRALETAEERIRRLGATATKEVSAMLRLSGERDVALARAEKAERDLVGIHDVLRQLGIGPANIPGEIRALRAERDDARADLAELKCDVSTIVQRLHDGHQQAPVDEVRASLVDDVLAALRDALAKGVA